MLNSTHTWIASSMPSSLTPAVRTGVRSVGHTFSGVSVSFSRKPSVARSFGSSGAARQSASTAATSASSLFSFFNASDATAP